MSRLGGRRALCAEWQDQETGLAEEADPLADSKSSGVDAAMTGFSVVMVGFSLFGDWNLIVNTFWPEDKYYFGWAVVFATLNIMGYWIMGLRGRSLLADANAESFKAGRFGRLALRLPLTSVAAVVHYDAVASLWGLITSTFPQYIINVSYALEHRTLTLNGKISLAASLVSLCISPVHTLVRDDIAAIKLRVRDLSKFDEIKHVVTGLRRRFVVLGPIILIEVIHFFPVLFERYLYINDLGEPHLSSTGYIAFLVGFNIPKLLFLMVCEELEEDPLTETPDQDGDTEGKLFWNAIICSCCGLPILIPCAVVFAHGSSMGLLVGIIIGASVVAYALLVVLHKTLKQITDPAQSKLFLSNKSKSWLAVLLVMPLVPCVLLIESGFKTKSNTRTTNAAKHNTRILVVYMAMSYGAMTSLLFMGCGKWTTALLVICLLLLALLAFMWCYMGEAVASINAENSSIMDKVAGGEGASWQKRWQDIEKINSTSIDLSGLGLGPEDAKAIGKLLQVGQNPSPPLGLNKMMWDVHV
jgi:hypothetical protein